MNPTEAYNYMKETGKSVSAGRTPGWIENPDWIKFRYSLCQGDVIASLYDDVSCASHVIDTRSAETWMSWWWNFCYNNEANRTELIPNERT